MNDPRLAELALLSHLEHHSTYEYERSETGQFGLPSAQLADLVFHLLGELVLNGSATTLERTHAGSGDPRVSAERSNWQSMKDLINNRVVSLRLNHAGRLRLYRLRDELVAGRDREQFDILWNRRAMDRALAVYLSQATEESPIAVLMLDVDHFKQVNDEHGHDVGDRVLRALFRLVREETDDHAYRYGGEELVVLLPSTLLIDAETKAEKLRKLIESTAATEASFPKQVTASIGVGAFSNTATSERVLKLVDQELLRAKDDGRNRVCVVRESEQAAGSTRARRDQ